MIVVKLMGGLGNQMFQYAAGKALSCKYNIDVKVDTSFLNTDTKGNYTTRKFELNIFNSNIKIATDEDLKYFNKTNISKFSRLLQRKFPSLFRNLTVVESGSNYHPEFNNYPKNTYLDGFWQSEKYFEKYKEQVKSDYSVTQQIPDELNLTLNKIISTNSVSIHVRRGDFISLKSANDFHGTQSLNYYQLAIDIITKNNKNFNIFIFSDDIEWCKLNLNFNFPIHFSQHNYNPYWDMFLMSNCKHNIIANSSFSWWAAWLNQNKEKIVIAPKNWFVDKTINTNDLIPSQWIQI